MPYYADSWLTVYGGDCRDVMRELEPESVHCVVTSPPYWGLRDYGTASWEGGSAECEHKGEPLASSSSSLAGYTSENVKIRTQRLPMGQECRKCGATRQDAQLGLEATPEEYVANLVDVFREVRRVLRSDGTVWLNLGDSYASGTVGRNDEDEANLRRRFEMYGTGRPKAGRGLNAGKSRPTVSGLKPKDLVGIPWRVAFALQADGWYLRSDIIWSKPNPMPESVTDRPTKSHEYLFLLSKAARYYYDAAAVSEPAVWGEPNSPESIKSPYGQGFTRRSNGFNRDGVRLSHGEGSDEPYVATENSRRNLRSVWTIATQPYPGAHFATFPRKLVEPCVKAGCPENGVVLDPFAGSGTTGAVAQALNRSAILIDLNPDYLAQAMGRNRDIPLGLGVA